MDWDSFIRQYDERLNLLAKFEIILPLNLFQEIYECREIYSESLAAYLYGLSNSCVPMAVRCLELGLKQKYLEMEKKEPKLTLEELLDWGEKKFGAQVTEGHSFRRLRNIIHFAELIEEADALECLRHTTRILNILYPVNPFKRLEVDFECPICKRTHEYEVRLGDMFPGNKIELPCWDTPKYFTITIDQPP